MTFRSKIKNKKYWNMHKEGWKTKSCILRGVVPLWLVVNVGWSALWRTRGRTETQTEKQSTTGQFTMEEDKFQHWLKNEVIKMMKG